MHTVLTLTAVTLGVQLLLLPSLSVYAILAMRGGYISSVENGLVF